ncbi:MAG TPA: mandelate racemase/muconate lactonizing enzyme family protein [Bryobacteraceae bacterium]|nr:mandelate racemase/muconate lactonizing enzyme family protein [Bryobacteraceae bacterium]
MSNRKQERMLKDPVTRRNFFAATAAGTAAGFAALADPGLAAAQSAGVKKADLPDLTIKQVKVYVTDTANIHRLNGTETGEIVSVVTNSGHEGNYTIGNRERTTGWLDWAKATLVGKNVVDLLPTLNATSGMRGAAGFNARSRTGGGAGQRPAGAGARPAGGNFVAIPSRSGGSWPDYKAAAADVCLWDVLGKAVDRPIYKLLGGSKDRMMAYASSQHLPSIEDYVPDAMKAKQEGYVGYKIHPGAGQHKEGPPIPSYIGHMEEIKNLRKALGDEYVLAHDPVQAYNRYEALKVGRLLDELDYLWFEDPIRTVDTDGLAELANALDVPLHVGEFLASISDFAEYIRRGALDVVRLIADNVGGISGSMRVGLLADAFGLECTPHNWGNVLDLAVHFHLELALPNAYWFEMPHPAEYADRPYHKDKFRIDSAGYVHAPTAPGLGYPIDRDALDKMTKRIDV